MSTEQPDRDCAWCGAEIEHWPAPMSVRGEVFCCRAHRDASAFVGGTGDAPTPLQMPVDVADIREEIEHLHALAATADMGDAQGRFRAVVYRGIAARLANALDGTPLPEDA